MISKELLSEVVGNEVSEIRWINQQKKELQYDVIEDLNYTTINIYELAHRCKEWAFYKGFVLKSYKKQGAFSGTYHYAIDINDKICEWLANTEYEAIFKACEWIFKIINDKQ